MTRPAVSVVITTFNQGAYVAEAVESALTQTVPPSEVVVIDDGSTDNTRDVMQRFARHVRYVQQPNRGVPRARNRGVRESTGGLVAFLDGDDRWYPDKMKRQLDAYDRYPDSGLIACDGQLVAADGRVLLTSLFGRRVPRPTSAEDAVTSENCFDQFLGGSLLSSTSQALIPRAVLDQVGDADPALPFASMLDIFLRIAVRYPVTFVHEVLMDWRYLETSASGPLETRPFRWGEDTVSVLLKHLRTSSPERRARIRNALRQRSRHLARAAFYRSEATNRQWGFAYLWRLWKRTGGDPVVAAYLLALATPQRIRSRFASTPWGRRILDERPDISREPQ